jgi:hypothetical protein
LGLGANRDTDNINWMEICDECTRELGEWFDDGGEGDE